MKITDSIHTAIVRSGRSNSSIILDGSNLILVDCGAGPLVLKKYLSTINMSIEQITGAVITHAHGDHMNEATLRKLTFHGIPIYCEAEVKEIAVEKTKEGFQSIVKKHMHEINVRKEFKIGAYKIKAFNLRHDSEGACFGYIFKKKMPGKTEKIVYATDFAYPSERIKKLFRNADIIFIESDHCDKMLDECYIIPEYVKDEHIRKYHISNSQCCEMLKEILLNSDTLPHKILLLHIADNINTEKKALSTCKRMLKKNGFKNIAVDI